MSIYFEIGKVFLIVLAIILFILIFILNTRIQLHINKLNKDSINKLNNTDAKIKIVIMFRNLKIFNKKIKKPNINVSIKNSNINMDQVKIAKYIISNIQIEEFKLNLQMGVNNIMITTYMVPIICSVISTILNWKHCYKADYIVTPIYNKNGYRITFDCIISLKLVHIIHIMYILLKKGEMKNGRTSYRRAYEHSYE